MTIHVGVDGCRYGWVAAYAQSGELKIDVFKLFNCVLQAFPTANVFVDIPIGLPSQEAPRRLCDVAARECLKKRHPTVFSPPCRDAINAANIAAARKLNVRELNRSLSAQSFAICPKIAEVDAILLSDPVARGRVRETHPEVCFWALNSRTPMHHSKSTKAGYQERMAVLSRHAPTAQRLLESVMLNTRRKDVQRDDVLDALVAYVAASAPKSTQRSLSGIPQRDEKGLPMRIMYSEPS